MGREVNNLHQAYQLIPLNKLGNQTVGSVAQIAASSVAAAGYTKS